MSRGVRVQTARSESKPPRIGIWCRYHQPLARLPGCREFVDRVVGCWLDLPEPPEIVLVCRPEDRALLAGRFGDRLEIHGGSPGPKGGIRDLLLRAIARWLGAKKRLRNCRLEARALKRRVVRKGARKSLHIGKELVRQKPKGWRLAVGLLALALPFVFVASWMLQALAEMARGLLRVVGYPLRLVDTVVGKLQRKLGGIKTAEAIATACRCDAWFILPPGLSEPLPPTSVLLIHDPATGLFPEMRQAALADSSRRLLPSRFSEAALCICATDFVRDQLVHESVGLAADKMRVVLPASPASEAPVTPARAAARRPPFLVRPYLFVPPSGRHRPYDPHAALVQALAIYEKHFGAAPFDLLFASFGGSRLAAELAPLVEECGLGERVLFVLDADREMLSALYEGAGAAVLVDPYEQGAGPLEAALHQGCPVACARRTERTERFSSLEDALLWFNSSDPDGIARLYRQIFEDGAAVLQKQLAGCAALQPRSWRDLADELLAISAEISVNTPPAFSVGSTLASQPWPPLDEVAARGGPPEIFLFLATFYRGGVWETTKDLLHALIAINRRRRQLKFTLGIHEHQTDVESLQALGDELAITRVVLDRISGQAGPRGMPGIVPATGDFCFMKGGEKEALRADGWLALVDRFHLPLLPVRPYGIVVYDMIQRHVPEAFDRTFFRHMESGMRPTARAAELIVVTSPATRDDVIAEYGIDPGRVRLAPVACEPERRFRGLMAEPVPLPPGAFILNVANSAPHKGAAPLLRAHAALKQQRGAECPFLVICGWKTDAFSKRHALTDTFPYWVSIRRLVNELGLEEDRDVVFLGYVDDHQLLDLYRRCALVVNAAKYDNGSFSVIEGRYFGREVISSDYPASRFLCERFGLNARYFPVDDHEALARVLDEALAEMPRSGMDLEQIRATLADAELRPARYAERIYEALVELGNQGRKLRESIRSAA